MKNIYTTSDKIIPHVQHLHLNSFEYFDFNIEINQYDGLIFTSQHGVESFFKNQKDWLNIPSYAIGDSTASLLKQYNSNLVFTAKKSYGNDFAKEIKKITQGEKLLYIRGKKVASNLSEILGCDELIVYKNSCKETKKLQTLPKNSFVIFTSPLLVDCFFKHFIWDKSFTAIAIGNTTAKAFPNHITPKIAKKPSMESCLELVYSHSSC
jgi:uroporphyrinogen-III synthase